MTATPASTVWLCLAVCCATGILNLRPAVAAPSECRSIAEDSQRLACYDRAFPRAGQTAAGPWSTRSAPSLLAGKTNQTVSRDSQEEFKCRLTRPRRMALKVMCRDNVTSIAFETGCYMTSSEYRSYGYVTYRLDTANTRIAHMVAGPDNHSLGFWSGDAAIPFIRELLGKKRIEVKMTPYAEDPIAASFDLSGMEDAIKPVRKECGW